MGLSDDNNLIGYMQLIQELFKSDPGCLSKEEQGSLAIEIVTRCLFSLEIVPYNKDITKGVDILASEKPQLNKCHSI